MRYQAYGLTISSDIPLLLPEEGFGAPDVTLVAGSLNGVEPHVTPTSSKLDVPGVMTFLASDGREVVYERHPDAGESAVRRSLVGAAMGVVLQQRGLLVLHAATVLIDGGVVAFAGPSGAGKSTLTEAFHRAGYACYSDDLALIDTDTDTHPLVLPGVNVVRLRPDSAEEAGWSGDSERRAGLDDKASKTLERPPEPAPLRAVYALDVGADIAFSDLGSADGLRLLTASTRANGMLQRDPASARRHLQQCGQVMSAARLKRLVRPRRFADLPDVVAAVVADVAQP